MPVVTDRPTINFGIRVVMARAFIILVFIVLAARLWQLQILHGDSYRDRSENNRRRTVFVPAPRGLILDRNGEVLVRNRASFNVELVTEDTIDPEETIRRIAKIVDEDPAELLRRTTSGVRRMRFEPKLILKDVSRETLAKIVSNRARLPGVLISAVPIREYVHGSLAAHTIGYIREITKEQLNQQKYAGYRQGDLIGQSGIEYFREDVLGGEKGRKIVYVNSKGVRIKEASFWNERPGKNVTLTLDFAAQHAADEALKGKTGAIVALNPNTGEVLAISSSPAFDPAIFTGEISSEEWKHLQSGEDKVLSNRPLQGGYPPGSVFKMIMGVAGLAEGVVRLDEKIGCDGHLMYGRRAYHCHKRSGHGAMDLYHALVQSCDVYFYQVGIRLGVDRINKYATMFGLGRPTELKVATEHPGLVPSTEWKRKYFKKPDDQKWWPGETLSVAIGQGATVSTPIQMARAMAALVNGGNILQPHIISRVEAGDGSWHTDYRDTTIDGVVDVEPWILEAVRKGMVGVVNDPLGTGHRAQVPKELGVTVAGKTGTSQVVSLAAHRANTADYEHHAWFVGYAPAESPEIVVSALIEHGGGGGVAAAPVVEQVIEAYFRSQKNRTESKL